MALVSPEDEGSRSINALNFSMASDIVELVVLTSDEAFLQTLREAVGGARRLWHVLAGDKVSDLLVAGEVGIVVIDVASLREGAQVFVSQIKRQFPDLVVVVAGHRDAELALAPAISAGTVYRFIHKPMSPNRARLFVEAAVRKYGEQRRAALYVPPPPGRSTAWYFGIIGAVAAAALIVALVISLRGRPQPAVPLALQPAAPTGAVTTVLGKAAQALAANRLTAPPGDNALELYLQASALSPADPAARNGLAEVRERLLARAENALLEERLDEAADAIETARKSGVESARIAFLNAQLAKSRDQLRATQSAARAKREASVPAQTPPQERPPAAPTAADTAASFAGLAVERIAEGRLLEPDQDNARHYVAEALRADPQSEVASEARQTLAARLLIEARSAIDRRDFARAADWLQSAEGIALPVNIETTRGLLQIARQQAQSDAMAQLLRNGTGRLREDRLIEPDGDSAKYYLLTLRGLDPQYAGLSAAMSELGAKLLGKARLALTLQQYAAARSWLDEAVAVGTSPGETGGVSRDLDTAMAQQKAAADVVPATQLTLLKSVAPSYPARAESNKLEGWVEVDFTVTESGQTADTAVHAANPSGVFDEAALRAVSQWRYQPVERDGRKVAVRSRVRIRFTP